MNKPRNEVSQSIIGVSMSCMNKGVERFYGRKNCFDERSFCGGSFLQDIFLA